MADLPGIPARDPAHWDSIGGRGEFPQTRWTRVLEAQAGEEDAEDAIADLCRQYWFPLYAFVRRQGKAAPDAQDLTQGFFADLLKGDFLAKASSARGRLRSYLLAGIKHYMAYEYRRETAQKRGGGSTTLSIDEELAEQRYQNEPSDDLSPDLLFERRWALDLLSHVVERLRKEYEDAGKADVFRALSPHLTEQRGGVPYAEIAGQLGTKEGAARVALHRMRARYRDCLVREVAETVESPDLVDAEIRHLIAALG